MYSRQYSYPVSQAGLFSAVSSAFVIDVYPKLQPDSNDQSAALLRALLITLNQSSVLHTSFAAPPVQEDPPGEIITSTALLYASLLISLLAAFIAMLGKQWLNRYLRHAGGSMIERCGDRQRKCNGLEKWPFHLFVESLPVMLQIALLLLACGLCQYMASVNITVAYTLFVLTGLGVVFYFGIVIAGASSYDCPFQTPPSVPLRSLWRKIGPRLISTAFLAMTALHALGEISKSHIPRITIRLPPFNILGRLRDLSERIQLRVLRVGLYLPATGFNILPSFRHPILPTIQEVSPSHTSRDIIPWFVPGELAEIRMNNTNDVRCVSWVIRNITDPEALDAAIQLAGTIRWFDDEIDIDVKPVYDLIVSAFHACFGSDRQVYPGSRDRAYHSGRAILWIHTLAIHKSRAFTLPTPKYRASGHLYLTLLFLAIQMTVDTELFTVILFFIPKFTPSHSQWISNLLLHLSWARIGPSDPQIRRHIPHIGKIDMPLNALLNYLLMFCNLLSTPVDEEVLKVQDKLCGNSYLYPSNCLQTVYQ